MFKKFFYLLSLIILSTTPADAQRLPPASSPVDLRVELKGNWQRLLSDMGHVLQVFKGHGAPGDIKNFNALLSKMIGLYHFKDTAKLQKIMDQWDKASGERLVDRKYFIALFEQINPDCVNLTASFDRKGNLILPFDMSNFEVHGGEISIDATSAPPLERHQYVGPPVPLEQTFPNAPQPFVLGDWTQSNPCTEAIGQVPIELPLLETPEAVLDSLGEDPRDVESKIADRLDKPAPSQPPVNFNFDKRNPGFVLDPTAFLSNRDIIFVHGLNSNVLMDAGNFSSLRRWPDSPNAFLPNGYWHSEALSEWGWLINWLRNRGAKNRYILASWSSAQRLDIAVNSVASQIKLAMQTGDNVEFIASPADKSNFCEPSCVIISNSTGAMVSDVILGIGAREEAGSAVDMMLWGDFRDLYRRVKFHLSTQGAFGGSEIIAPAIAIAQQASPYAQIPGLTQAICDKLKCGVPNPQLPGPIEIMDTVLVDLLPPISVDFWQYLYMRHSRIPTMMLAASSADDYISGGNNFDLLKQILPGVDDGVLTADSQCANPRLPATRPSGYMAKFYLSKTFDLGVGAYRGLQFYKNQVLDPRVAAQRVPFPGYVSNACNPYLSSTGMVQPVASVNVPHVLSTRFRLPLHCPILLSNRMHPEHLYLNVNPPPSDRNEVVLINDCSFLYSGDNRIAGDVGAYLNAGIGQEVFTEDRGHYIGGQTYPYTISCCRFHHFFSFTIYIEIPKIWIWRRTYMLMSGYQSKSPFYYVYDYVGR
ncbi:MAG: hypothetical protein WCE79_19470 [Xanthobacteraceae bacterium]